MRRLRFFQPASYIAVDCAAQEVEAWYVERRNGGQPKITGGRVDVPRDEPLRRELADFVRAVQRGEPPGVTGEDGRRALALAERIAGGMQAADSGAIDAPSDRMRNV